ncbi:ATPase [Starkeya sp. ORNL1]|uniref:sensor histidine kinase n=1 Tax=Starkeya sp. ORNL1 TaxID=2709380 RepID=UPI001463D071|nr:histidine kinase [Starkeya sp. ORNL1]QJP13073.1 ATPase [Starkeya sp. ORNL1]
MSLLLSLTLRLIGVVLFCLVCAIGWIMQDTDQSMRLGVEASAQRVARQIETRPGLGSAGIQAFQPPSLSDWQMDAAIASILPGVCVEFGIPSEVRRRLCGGWDGLGDTAPQWFGAVYDRVFDVGVPVVRPIMFRGREVGTVIASLDRVAAVTGAWRQVRVMAGMAVAIALGMCLLAALAVGHALLPVQAIIAGLRRLEAGDHASRLPALRITEFRRIAEAVNDLADRLERTTAERTALTRRLFQVQEDERRALARELHDEFGQCLTAVSALAASMEAGAERPDIAADASAISRITAQMMATLRGAFARLRPPDLDELGLETSLRNMVAGWNTLRGGRAEFRMEVEGDLASVPPGAALNIYRIAQECFTNAARHGNPTRVVMRLTREGQSGGSVGLVVDDNGGGDPDLVGAGSGFGILGIRERIGALGGTLSIGRSAGGVRIAALVPLAGAAS